MMNSDKQGLGHTLLSQACWQDGAFTQALGWLSLSQVSLSLEMGASGHHALND
jgi:hypothetical protein